MRKGRWGNLAVVSSDWLPDSIITVHTSEMKHLKSLASFIETPDLKPVFAQGQRFTLGKLGGLVALSPNKAVTQRFPRFSARGGSTEACHSTLPLPLWSPLLRFFGDSVA